jgi:diguanylate cyclase (GGDEF)-like protein
VATPRIPRWIRHGHPQRVAARVWALVALCALSATAVSLLAVTRSDGTHVGHPVPWPLICLALVAAQQVPVRFHTERQSQTLDLFGLPMLLGAVFCSPSGLLLAAAGAAVVRGLLRGDPLVRKLFNLGNQVTGVAAALLVLAATLGHSSPVSLHGWWALSVTLLTYEVATDLGVLGAVSLSAGLPDRSYLKEVCLHLLLVLPINAALGIVAVTVGWTQRWALLLLAAAGAVLAIWYEAANTLRTRYADLQLLYGFTAKLAGLSERDEVLAIALAEARTLLRCAHAELWVPGSNGGSRHGVDRDGHLTRARLLAPGLERDVVASGEPLLLPKGRRGVPVADRGFLDLMAVPLPVGEDEVGVLTVADRRGDESATFEPADLRLFEAVAAHLGTALTSSRRLDQLRHEVAAREHEALHDSLTGLANRTLFTRWVSSALQRRDAVQRVGVMLMDLDGFKEVNDTLGHHTGDAILKEIGLRVLAAVGPNHLAARLGGDEFAFVIPSADSLEEVSAAAAAVLESVSQPLTIDGLVLVLRASLGVSMAPEHGLDPSTLLKRADVAMYAAKSANRGVLVYDPEIDHYTTRRLMLAGELRRAVAAEELEVWFQPVADLPGGQVSGFEALLRWQHPVYGAITPNEFIPVAEQTGLIEPLTWWVLRRSLEEQRRWQDDGYQMTMAVNMSARSLLDTEIVDRLGQLLVEVGVPASSLIIEVTESSIMAEPDRAERILSLISDLGVSIAIDDFGTGYSSLSRLKKLPVSIMKIDRSFVKHLCADDGDEAIVRTTIELARNMGHTVIAEGVEDLATWNRLIDLGCDQIQGFFLTPALPSQEIRAWLRQRQLPTVAPIRVLRPLAQGA